MAMASGRPVQLLLIIGSYAVSASGAEHTAQNELIFGMTSYRFSVGNFVCYEQEYTYIS